MELLKERAETGWWDRERGDWGQGEGRLETGRWETGGRDMDVHQRDRG